MNWRSDEGLSLSSKNENSLGLDICKWLHLTLISFTPNLTYIAPAHWQDLFLVLVTLVLLTLLDKTVSNYNCDNWFTLQILSREFMWSPWSYEFCCSQERFTRASSFPCELTNKKINGSCTCNLELQAHIYMWQEETSMLPKMLFKKTPGREQKSQPIKHLVFGYDE